MKKMKATIILCLCTFLLIFQSYAKVEPALLFSDHMVLQRNVEVPVWGWAAKRERITVEFNNQVIQTKADKSGKWMLKLAPTAAGGPYKMTIKGKNNTIVIEDILVGEVWVCSGQSNMEWMVKNSNDAEKEIANANDKLIRHFKVSREISSKVKDKLPGGKWDVCSSETVSTFTAVGYFFAKQLRAKLNVPIGLVNSSWGGTNVETWTSSGAISTIPKYTKIANDMQNLNMEEMYAQQLADLKAKIGDFPEKDAGIKDGKAIWAASDLDDAQWSDMNLPGLWENKGLPGVDGVVWFRKAVELTDEEAAQKYTLHLSKIDDSDKAWINGELVGQTKDAYNEERKYEVASGILKPGKNVITIRIEDTGGGGGVWGAAEIFKLASLQKTIELAGSWKYKIGEGKVAAKKSPNSYPSLLFNAMLNPLIPYAMKGVIWYQGESNAGQAYTYRALFPLLIKDWREKWGAGDFPFLWVQLANFKEVAEQPIGSDWAELREAQTMTLSLPNTGQAVIIDIGEADDIHPRNKQDVGLRLSLAARKIAYGEEIVYSSPMYKEMKLEGNKVRISFDHTGSGLMIKDKYGYINGFAVAGADKKFHWAMAELVGDEVVIYSDKVSNPVAVRYGWADNPDDLNLYNKEGLPACPFRTDDWPGITQPN
ncbi:MAG: sialate O-acetylesterase [Bacteroidota bacterium]